MGGLKDLCCVLLGSTVFFTFCLHATMAGKVLVFPVDGSHWINMNLMIEGLHARGHEITVVRTSTSWYIKESSPHYKSITVTLPEAVLIEDPDFFVSFLSKMLEINRQGGSPLAFMKFLWEMFTMLAEIHQQASQLVVEMFENKTLMEELRATHYDVALIDPGIPAGVLVAHKLELPIVFNVRWITSGEGHFVVAPSPVSYVPTGGCAVSNQMTFGERVKNTLRYILNLCSDRFIVSPPYNALMTRYFGPDANFYHLLQGVDLWLMRVDFVFEFPRPTMPNIVYIGGFQCKPAKPIPAELQEFVDGSGEHGLIVMSLGTLVKGLPIDITSEIAAAFAQLPQRVIWRHLGERPNNLGNNTLLVKWLPQNDLLGHPKTRLFVTHGGTNGVYESIYHGIPIVGVPLLFDQYENVLRLKVRGAAKVVDVATLDSQEFLKAIQEVLHQPSYRDNMQRLSRLHKDRPMHPLDSALYWIEFVMRHKGAAHLRTESYKMPWYSYHSLDVVGLLLAVLLALVGVVVLIVRFLCLRLCRRQKPKQE
ncbi:UDP-glucuronosyltransferase 2A2-like [Colossoma macropomum]|uniref:UDP-glucuronosyltransferase 2A2-like n=1 Tax=Colossoma macropomum TaxID=42526 RepID=UPI001865007B|nr:UDP-glucuronosyltransferase 2A2-like [Colossoma macropomum]XP_036447452.1 UDP-glucuronosyltransferase 2A2-like [Colossoma macropomum]XP_036447459.1 UDP-glucuronosyltransferase 2A2-like [Colossoma macropomum]